MSNAELIEALRRAEGSETLRSVYLGMLNAEHRCKQAADALSAYEWRTDMEVAKKENGYVLVCQSKNGIVRVAKWIKEYGNWATGSGAMSFIANVTHWMPLPKPTTGEQ